MNKVGKLGCWYNDWKASRKIKKLILEFLENSETKTKVYILRGNCNICRMLHFIELLIFQMLKEGVESEQILRINHTELQERIISHIRKGNWTITNLFYNNKLLIVENVDMMTCTSCQREFYRYLKLICKENKKRLVLLTTESQSEIELPEGVNWKEIDV